MSESVRESVVLTATAAAWFALAFIGALLVLFAAPRLVGGQSYAVLSDSMRGAVGVGDQIVVLPHRASAVVPGEIVAFDEPGRTGRLLQHRVESMTPNAGRIEFVTRGDANSGRERWSVPADGSIGRVVAVVPKAGYLLGRLGTPVGRSALILVTAAALTLLALAAIWSSPAGAPRSAREGGDA